MNFEKYIGIPFQEKGRDTSGVDCWGLVRLIYKQEYSINLPSFSEDYELSDDVRIGELFAQYQEGWETLSSPEPGCAVLFRMFGTESHIGVVVEGHKFIHVREGRDSVIESLESPKWSKRIVGYFKYSESAGVVLNSIPHPLKTQQYVSTVVPGTRVLELVHNICTEYNVQPELKSRISVLINGIVVPQEAWASTTINLGDVIEYRAVPGKEALRLVAIVALALVAPQIALSALGTTTGAYVAAALGGTPIFLAAAQAGVMLLGSVLINAIAPIRPPTMGSSIDPGSAERQLMVNGGANQLNPYGAIPVVLGKVRVTPLLGSVNYLTYEKERDSYLSMLLVWGYGPLNIDGNSFKIGDVPLTSYTDYTKITLDHIEEPTAEIKRNFDAIYGKDVTQVNTQIELTCDGNPEIDSRTITGTVANYPASTIEGVNSSILVPASSQLRYDFRESKGWVVGQTASIVFTVPTGHSGWTFSTSTTGLSNVVVTDNSSTVKTVSFVISSLSKFVGTNIGLYIEQENLSGSYVITAKGPIPGPWTEAATTVEINPDTGLPVPVNSATIALHFPQGLRRILTKGEAAGNSYYTNVKFRVEYSKDNGTTWSLLENLYVGNDTVKKDGFTYTRTYGDLNSPQVIIRVRRETGDNTEDNPNYRYYFTSILQNVTFLRNATPAVDPVDTKLAKTAFKIKATDQLNGSIQGISAVVQTWCKKWNGLRWVDGATSNPAALMRYVLEHPANPRKVTNADSQINLDQLQYFYEYCETHGFEYNGILGTARGVLDVIRDICAAGRASPSLIDGKWTVVIDEPRTNIVQHFTPHNSWNFEGTKALPKRPDGLRVNYYDQDSDYQEAEIIVYDTGKNSGNASLFESITLPGVTKKSLVIDHAKWHMAQMKLRPEVYTLNSDIEYLVCNRGDRVKVMHDVPMWGLGSGRVKNILSSTQVELDEPVQMKPGVVHTIRFRTSTGASVTKTIVNVSEDGEYSIIDLTTPIINSEIASEDLFLFGTLDQEAQDLVVLSIEPSSNNSARLTLVDYGVTKDYNIFTDYLNLSELLVFESQITLPPMLQLSTFGNKVPKLTGLTSDESAMDIVAQIYNINLTYFNASELPTSTHSVEIQYDLASSDSSVNLRSLFVEYQKGSTIIPNVSVGEAYRIRLRYISKDGTSGVWTQWQNHTVQGLTVNNNTVQTIEVSRVGKFLRVKCLVDSLPNTFKYFKVKVFKDSGSGDFWTNTDSGIFVGLTQTDSIDIDLMQFASPRISEAGTKYRVACRVVDISGNESLTSAVGSITLQTIIP